MSIAHTHKSNDKGDHQCQDHHRAHKTELLTYGTEDKVGVLLRHKTVADIRTMQIALTRKTSRTDSNFRLVYIVVERRVFGYAQEGHNTILLVGLQYVEYRIRSWGYSHRGQKQHHHYIYITYARTVGIDPHSHQRQQCCTQQNDVVINRGADDDIEQKEQNDAHTEENCKILQSVTPNAIGQTSRKGKYDYQSYEQHYWLVYEREQE